MLTGFQYRKQNYSDWIDELFLDENSEEMDKLFFRRGGLCSFCDTSACCLHYLDSPGFPEQWNHMMPNNSCKKCKGKIWQELPILLIVDTVHMSSLPQSTLPEYRVVFGERYRLAFVQEIDSKRSHFHSTLLYQSSKILKYDGLNPTNITTIKSWPRLFHHPTLVIYEKVNIKLISSNSKAKFIGFEDNDKAVPEFALVVQNRTREPTKSPFDLEKALKKVDGILFWALV
jgi:hypothetical protein